jgi:RNA polymerase sigma-70 factor (ECF subfamily)
MMCGSVSVSASGSTSHTLLERVKLREPDAWRRFVDVYGPLVTYWCRRSGLGDEDAADVVQETFRSVAQGIVRFRHDREHGTFRGWLRTIVGNKLRNWARDRRNRSTAAGGDEAYRLLAESPDPLSTESGSENDATEQSIVFQGSLELIRAEFNDRTWQAFWRLAVDNAVPADVAIELGLSLANVYQSKCRVLRRLRKELEGLEQ